MEYLISRDQLGQAIAINRQSDGASLLFDPDNKTFVEDHFLTKELREWETKNGLLDLSDVPPDLELTKLIHINQVIEEAKNLTEALVVNYSPAERASWTEKVAQAKAYISSSNLDDAPYLKAEVAASLDTEDTEIIADEVLTLAQSILANSTQLHLEAAAVVGKRRKAIAAIENATTVSEVLAVNINSKQ